MKKHEAGIEVGREEKIGEMGGWPIGINMVRLGVSFLILLVLSFS